MGRVVASRVKTRRLRADEGLAGSKHTDAYRLINSEGDRLSGVCVDMYGDVAVASVSAAWANAARADIISAVRAATNATRVAWRIDRKMLALETGRDEDDEDGEDEDDVVTDAHATRWYDASTGEEIFVSGDGDDDDDASSAETEIRENGVAYGVDLARGHKTGFYVDQRDNRAFIRDIAAGKDLVMDVCCYTGGFALNAALGGARRVIGVDSSRPALDIAERNAARNGVTETCEFIRAEAFRHLDACLERGEAGTYDVIVLDPPKFAPNASSLPSAVSKYVGLNQRAMRLLRRADAHHVHVLGGGDAERTFAGDGGRGGGGGGEERHDARRAEGRGRRPTARPGVPGGKLSHRRRLSRRVRVVRVTGGGQNEEGVGQNEEGVGQNERRARWWRAR